ncbi:MAG: polysaccharide deacetylase family protein [Bacteroidetes bacterium]|nr:polysaccharide deacetylase family protein [Bacteroidota bacterium]MBU1115823.1 polysaccharide deacetylase family protein [Bacteroidota bacterium]MBU1800216.1 polysaccharide deacetylase family protein [Bacteroidota bacterium]
MMKKTKYVPPKIFHKLFPKTIWESKVDKILFTFDDGPNPETTPKILDKLKEHSIKAIFFCVGENVERYPELSKQIIRDGHLIGNHTISHQNINFFNRTANSSIIKCSEIIEKTVGVKPKYFRPPHGRIGLRTETLMKRNNLTNVMWSLLTYDYKSDFNIVIFAVDKYLNKNSIIVLHDSLKSQAIIEKSIDYIIEKTKQNGYEIGDPSKCLK